MGEKRETGRPGGAGRPARSTEQHPTPTVLCCGIRLRRIPVSPAPAAPGLHWRSRPPKGRAGTDVLCASPKPHLCNSLTLRTEGRARRGSARPLSARPRCSALQRTSPGRRMAPRSWRCHVHSAQGALARPPRRVNLRRAVAGTPVDPVQMQPWHLPDKRRAPSTAAEEAVMARCRREGRHPGQLLT